MGIRDWGLGTGNKASQRIIAFTQWKNLGLQQYKDYGQKSNSYNVFCNLVSGESLTTRLLFLSTVSVHMWLKFTSARVESLGASLRACWRWSRAE